MSKRENIYFNRNDVSRWLINQKGFSLMELLVSFSVVSMLLMSIITVFFFCIKAYAYELSDWVLQDEIRRSMYRIVHDLSYAEKVESNGKMLYIYLYKNEGEEKIWVTYERSDKLMHPLTRDKQPITGYNMLSSIFIRKFSYKIEPVAGKPARVSVELIGENLMTKHVFSLETSVTLKRML